MYVYHQIQLMKYIYTLTLLLCLNVVLHSQIQPTTYSRIKIDLRETSIALVEKLGLETDHGSYAPGKYLTTDFSSHELDLLRDNNIPFRIILADVKAHYHHQNEHGHSHEPIHERTLNNCQEDLGVQFDYDTPENYQFGSMGGYLTYDELLTTLDEMANLYPDLITVRQPIGTILTEEGRPIFWLRISDNPNMEENEPEVLYTALHHAREPNSLSQMIFYMWYLLENYETDPEVRYLVDNTAMHFIPCINPDGYVFNQMTDPNGGGLWRKNRSVENGQPVGVDLNRNYGFEWGFNNQGSSGNPNSEIYRGQAPFSEPETQAVRDFCIDHRFRICMNYHTFGNVLIYPFAFNDEETPDQPTYAAFTRAMASENNFPSGTGLETVGATANGESDDWLYGDTIAKPRIFSLTPEVGPGSFGFWPPQSAIDQLNKSVLLQNLVTAHLLLNYGEAEEVAPVNFITGEQGTFTFNLKKYGLATGTLNLNVSAVNNALSLTNTSLTTDMEHLDEATLEVNYTISEATEDGEEILLVLAIDNGQFISRDTIRKTYLLGDFATIASNDATDAQDWAFTETWGITSEEFVSSPSSITDSPNGNYAPDINNTSTWQIPIDLSNARQAFLNFYAMWDIEANFDYAQIMASTDGINYQPLCGNFTTIGNYAQDDGQPLYDGTQNDWVFEEIDLSDFLGQNIMIRFRIVSDGYVEGDGFYFDDISVRTLSMDVTSSANILSKNSLNLYPNPFTDALQVNFDLMQASDAVNIRLVNSIGKEVYRHRNQSFTAGANQAVINRDDLENGVYFLQLLIADKIVGVKRIVKIE